MDVVLRHRGREITASDVVLLRELIAAHPAASRRALSQQVCQRWGWVQPNGVPCDGICRSLLLALHRGGHITLPEPRRHVPRLRRRQFDEVQIAAARPLRCALAQLGPLEIRPVRRTAEEPLFQALLARYHYLGYTPPVGEHLKYLVLAAGDPIACFAWSSAPRHLGPRDRYLGWSAAARRRNISYLAYNSRFLILPWVRVPHLASYLLGSMTRMLSAEWQRAYGHPIYFAETFVDPERFVGTCYRAANWVPLGRTTGRGKDDQTNRPNRSRKEVLGLPLVRDFRRRLGTLA
ncbi:MAG TPA: Druantia anti-phage system protein DruA [Thermoanaerobaculia bacterium]|nr:Druantia anti-phage system protein DruA [Thermoanaerobaculia bacterium]